MREKFSSCLISRIVAKVDNEVVLRNRLACLYPKNGNVLQSKVRLLALWKRQIKAVSSVFCANGMTDFVSVLNH